MSLRTTLETETELKKEDKDPMTLLDQTLKERASQLNDGAVDNPLLHYVETMQFIYKTINRLSQKALLTNIENFKKPLTDVLEYFTSNKEDADCLAELIKKEFIFQLSSNLKDFSYEKMAQAAIKAFDTMVLKYPIAFYDLLNVIKKIYQQFSEETRNSFSKLHNEKMELFEKSLRPTVLHCIKEQKETRKEYEKDLLLYLVRHINMDEYYRDYLNSNRCKLENNEEEAKQHERSAEQKLQAAFDAWSAICTSSLSSRSSFSFLALIRFNIIEKCYNALVNNRYLYINSLVDSRSDEPVSKVKQELDDLVLGSVGPIYTSITEKSSVHLSTVEIYANILKKQDEEEKRKQTVREEKRAPLNEADLLLSTVTKNKPAQFKLLLNKLLSKEAPSAILDKVLEKVELTALEKVLKKVELTDTDKIKPFLAAVQQRRCHFFASKQSLPDAKPGSPLSASVLLDPDAGLLLPVSVPLDPNAGLSLSAPVLLDSHVEIRRPLKTA